MYVRTCTQCDDILDGSAEFHSGHVIAALYVEGVGALQQRGEAPRHALVPTCDGGLHELRVVIQQQIK